MIRRFAMALIVIGAVALHTLPTISAQTGAIATKDARAGTDRVPRAIRRDVPLTNSIRRAYEAGTRDQSGRPGPELLAAADRLHDRGAARSGDRHDHRHRDRSRSTTTARRS